MSLIKGYDHFFQKLNELFFSGTNCSLCNGGYTSFGYVYVHIFAVNETATGCRKCIVGRQKVGETTKC